MTHFYQTKILKITIHFLLSIASRFGQVPTNFTMDNVVCMGAEARLHDCRFHPRHDCKGAEGAGVSCQKGDLSQL